MSLKHPVGLLEQNLGWGNEEIFDQCGFSEICVRKSNTV